MKYSEFLRWLRRQGVTFEQAKGSHMKARLGDVVVIVPNHGSREMKEPLRKAIVKKPGLD